MKYPALNSKVLQMTKVHLIWVVKMTKILIKSFVDLRMLNEVHLLFFAHALPLFMHFFLLRSDPQAHNVYPMTKELAKKIANRFLNPQFFR